MLLICFCIVFFFLILDDFDEDDDNIALKHLSNVCDVFLNSFVGRLRFHKDSAAFRKNNDIWVNIILV